MKTTRLTPKTATDQTDILVQVDAMVTEALALEDNKGVILIQIIDQGDGTFQLIGSSRKKRNF